MKCRIHLAIALLGVCLTGCAPGDGAPAPDPSAPQPPADAAGPGWEELGQRLVDGDRSAIAALRERFRSTEDPDERSPLAWLLVLIGEGDAEHYDFLAGRARVAVESELPYPYALDVNFFAEVLQGKADAPPTAEFVAWCETRGMDPAVAVGEARINHEAVKWLGLTEDPRAVDLLIRGLSSQNVIVATQSAHGLGRIGDARGIGPIREAAARMPGPVSEFMGFTLLYFDDAEARAAADSLVRPAALEMYTTVATQDRLRRQAIRLGAGSDGAGNR